MIHSVQTQLSKRPTRFMNAVHGLLHDARAQVLHSQSISEYLAQVEKATSPARLAKSVNLVQETLWNLPPDEQTLYREKLIKALSHHTLQAPKALLRLAAANWLRVLTQAGLVNNPRNTFVTLITAVTSTSTVTEDTLSETEPLHYLKMIFECFWPFRYPYPAFTWEEFPANTVFYPLAPLISHASPQIQEALVAIFSELPALDDGEIATFLLPIALTWAGHSHSEYRRSITTVLAHLSDSRTQAALQRLLSDPDPIVRASARRATDSIRKI